MANGRFLLNNLLHGATITTAAKNAVHPDPTLLYTTDNTNMDITVTIASLDVIIIRRTNPGAAWTAQIGDQSESVFSQSVAGAANSDLLILVLDTPVAITDLRIAGLNGPKLQYILGGKLWQPEVNFNQGAGINLAENQNRITRLRSLNATWSHLTQAEAALFASDMIAALRRNSVMYGDLYPGVSGDVESRSRIVGFPVETAGPSRAPRGRMTAGIKLLEASTT